MKCKSPILKDSFPLTGKDEFSSHVWILIHYVHSPLTHKYSTFLIISFSFFFFLLCSKNMWNRVGKLPVFIFTILIVGLYLPYFMQKLINKYLCPRLKVTCLGKQQNGWNFFYIFCEDFFGKEGYIFLLCNIFYFWMHFLGTRLFCGFFFLVKTLFKKRKERKNNWKVCP